MSPTKRSQYASRCSWMQTQVGSGFLAQLDEKMSPAINKAAPGCRGREPEDVLTAPKHYHE